MKTPQSNRRWHPPLAVYQYEPLDKEAAGTIRILELHPGTYNDPIKVTLSLASIDGHGALPAIGPIPHADQDYTSYMDLLAKRMTQLKLQMRMWKASFQALSYEWGHDGDLGGHIFINGLLEPNPIRRNLELVLRTVRDRTKEKVLWIDSICINQHDPIERGQQVAMMGDIFSAATGVIAWLGPEAKGSGTAMDLIENTRKLETRMCLDRDLSESEMQALIILLHRTYWRRVWVIQELLMAKTCEIRCGSKIITRMQFNNFLGCINRPGTQFEDRKWAKARAGNPAEAHRLAHEFNIPGTTFKRLNTLRIWLRRCYKSGFEATDPRDLIYALIGAADDVPRGHLVPNYEGTIREALVQAVPYVRDDVSPWSPSAAQSLAFFMVQYAERMGLSAEDDLLQEILDIMNERPVLSQ